MKILLISSNTADTPYPVYPLGCSMVASALDKAGHQVRQFDFLMQEGSLDSLGREIKEFLPELIGISIRNIDNVNLLNECSYIDDVTKIVSRIRESSSSRIILGGAGFSLIPDLILKETGADYGIIGEGESLIVEFADRFSQGKYPSSNLIGPEKKLENRGVPSARYDRPLIDFYVGKSSIASLQTKRGCNHHCLYCTYPILEGTKIRQRDPAAVVDDLELLHKEHRARHIFFVDSVFNDDQGVYLEVIEEMRKRKLQIPWIAFFKPEGLKEQQVELMKQTGLFAVEFGSDAATDTTLKGLGKSFSFKDIEESNDLMVKWGISTSHFYMFGGPGETRETVMEGIENIKSLAGSVSFMFMGIRILPDTPLEKLAERQGLISSGDGLLKSVYYISPHVDRKWLEETLTNGFKGIRTCVFPPDALDQQARILYKLGYTGPLWNTLVR